MTAPNSPFKDCKGTFSFWNFFSHQRDSAVFTEKFLKSPKFLESTRRATREIRAAGPRLRFEEGLADDVFYADALASHRISDVTHLATAVIGIIAPH